MTIDITPPTLVDIHKKWKMRPEFDKYIGRKMTYPPSIRHEFPWDSKWQNPFIPKKWEEATLIMYEIYIRDLLGLEEYSIWFPISDYNYTPPLHHELLGLEFTERINLDNINIGHFIEIETVLNQSRARWSHWDLAELTGMRLGCWCITTDSWENPVCHGQILMKLWHEAYQKGELDDD